MLRASLDRAEEGEPGVVLLIGEAGIGKTRLLREAEREARDREAMVLRGDCLQLEGGELPYAPLAAALRDAPPDPLAEALEQLGAQARAELERAFPQLGGTPAAGEADRFAQARLYEALVSLLGALAERAPVLLVLEDLQWVDRSTREFVRFLVRGLRWERVAVAMTFRTGELAAEHPVREMLAELQYHDRVALAELGPLARDGVAAQLEGILGEAPAADIVDEVHERCGGNPLFAEELLSARMDEAGGELPERLADALRVRLRRASAPVRRLLPYGAAIGRPASSDLLAAAGGVPEPELSTALREAVDHHLLAHRRDGTFAFRHDVMRQAVYADLLGGERAACTPPSRARSDQARPAPSSPSTGAPPAARRRRCAPPWAPAWRRRRPAPSGRRCATSTTRSSTGTRAGSGCRWIGSSCSATPPRAPATRASTTRPSPGVRRPCGCSTAAPTPPARRCSTSGSAACRRSRATAGTARSPRRCGCSRPTTAPGAPGCSAPRPMPCGRSGAWRRRRSAARRRSRSPTTPTRGWCSAS